MFKITVPLRSVPPGEYYHLLGLIKLSCDCCNIRLNSAKKIPAVREAIFAQAMIWARIDSYNKIAFTSLLDFDSRKRTDSTGTLSSCQPVPMRMGIVN